ncbi:hypothetical protein ACHHYP_01948 [Achlya hypogyna]|uniref:BRCT domain-containing protein n=1 Tax=Achlya hypogyna TaxID=1202772 RepID=A0A1V9ZSS0_ACHHY|nr:hypothetical protein ACHHYP_01948 [Achlya hypogyna]
METEVATEVVGDQETPSQWKKTTTQEAYEIASPKKLVLCSFDEDETQIRFLSNCLSQDEFMPDTKTYTTLMKLEERKLSLVNPVDMADGDDDDSGNESEDMWVGGTDLLAQWGNDVHKANERQSQVIADLPPYSETQAMHSNETSSDVETNASDDDASTQTNSAMAYNDKPTPPSSAASLQRDVDTEPLILDQPSVLEPASFRTKLIAASAKTRGPTTPEHTPVLQSELNLSATTSTPKLPRAAEVVTLPKIPTSAPESEPLPNLKPKRKASRKPAYTESEDYAESQPRSRKRLQRTPSESPSESSSFTESLPATSDGAFEVIRIVLTGIEPTESILRKIRAIKGAQFEEDVTCATHLVAPSRELKRTVKMLCGISCCLHILDEAWLHASAKMRRPADEHEYSLRDTAKEAQWGFELERTMYDYAPAKRRAFLQAHAFYITPHKSIKPPPAELEKIIQCAGGRVLATPRADCIVISSTEAVTTKTVQKKLRNVAHVCTTELILLGVLTQRLDFAAHRLPETVVDKLFRSRGPTLRLELQLQRMLAPESQNPSASLATFPCLLLFPPLLEAHRALLAGLRLVKSISPTLSDRARGSAALLYERALEFRTLHASYAWYHQLMPPPSDSRFDALFRVPLDCLESYAVVMDALAPYSERVDEWNVMCDRLHDAFSDITTQRTRAMDMLALEEGLGSDIDLVTRKLVAQNVVSIQMADADALQTGTLYLFEDLCLIVDTNGHDLFQLQAAEVCKALRLPRSDDCLVLTQDTHCTLLATPPVIASLMACINERFRAPHTFTFDLATLLHSMDGLPTSWLVPDTETAQHTLVRADLMWCTESPADRPRLCQYFLLQDMILYGHVRGMKQCTFAGYLLGEYVSLRSAAVHGGLAFEIVVTAAETQSETVFCLQPLDPAALQPWISHIATFTRAHPVGDGSSATTMASMALPSPEPVALGSPDVGGWVHKKSKRASLTPSSTETHMPSAPSPVTSSVPPPCPIDDTVASTPESCPGPLDVPSSALEPTPTPAPRAAIVAIATTLETPQPRLPRALSMSESTAAKAASVVKATTAKARRPAAKKKLVDTEPPTPLVVQMDDDVPLALEIAAKEPKKNKKPKAKKRVDAKAKSVPETPRDAPLPAADVATPVPVFQAAPPTSSGKKRKAKAAPPPEAKLARLEELPPSTQDLEGAALQFLCRIAEAPPTLRIVLTGFVSTDELLFKIAAIAHAQYEDDVMAATHIIAPRGKFKRTVKVLCGISCCLHILDEDWLHASAELGRAAPEAQFCLKDEAKEALWGFTLTRTMYSFSLAQRQSLLHGLQFYIASHKSILPPPSELTKIIQCAGGEVAPMATGLPREETVVIASKEAVATTAVQKQLAHMNRDKCFTVEFLLIGILQQTLHWDEFHVVCPLPRKGR